MREWKELLLSGVPLYEPEDMEDQQQDPMELERLEILNNQDYDEYTVGLGDMGGEMKISHDIQEDFFRQHASVWKITCWIFQLMFIMLVFRVMGSVIQFKM